MKSKCKHYWVIDKVDGPTSKGTCKLCGAIKEFSNYMTYDFAPFEAHYEPKKKIPLLDKLTNSEIE